MYIQYVIFFLNTYLQTKKIISEHLIDLIFSVVLYVLLYLAIWSSLSSWHVLCIVWDLLLNSYKKSNKCEHFIDLIFSLVMDVMYTVLYVCFSLSKWHLSCSISSIWSVVYIFTQRVTYEDPIDWSSLEIWMDCCLLFCIW